MNEHRKQAEERVWQDEGRLSLVIDTIPVMVGVGLPDGSLDFVNQQWLEYLGLSMEEAQGWGWTAAIHPDDVQDFLHEWRSVMATGEPFEKEARLRRADGEFRRRRPEGGKRNADVFHQRPTP